MAETSRSLVPGAEERTALALVNSADSLVGGRGSAVLSPPEAGRGWIIAYYLTAPVAGLQEHCHGWLASLRDDVRGLFTAHVTGDVPSSAAVDALNRALTSAPGALLLRFDRATRFTRSAEHPTTQVVEHAMAAIAEDAATLLTSDDAPLLAACEADSCQRFFLRTHARRQWCSNRCGDRVRAARAYARKRATRVS
ncbi:MAG: ABATE domain-containing protein [Actinomycetaceae bacterium]